MATAGQKRFASLDKDEMDEIMENLDAKNTKTQTHTAVKIFREYLTEKNLPLEFEMLSDQYKYSLSMKSIQVYIDLRDVYIHL
jgi:hypothetical protein